MAQAYIYHILFGNIRKLDKLTFDSVRNKHREPAASVLSWLSVNRTPYSTSHRSLSSTKGRFHRSAEEALLKHSSAHRHQATRAGNPRYFRPAATPRAYERLRSPYVYGNWTTSRPLLHGYFQHCSLAGNADKVIYRQSWKLHCASSNPG